MKLQLIPTADYMSIYRTCWWKVPVECWPYYFTLLV